MPEDEDFPMGQRRPLRAVVKELQGPATYWQTSEQIERRSDQSPPSRHLSNGHRAAKLQGRASGGL